MSTSWCRSPRTTDPSDETEDACETKYWALQDANYNALAIVDSDGDLKERYEYTPYGQRTVYESPGSNDPRCHAPILESQRVTADGLEAAYGLCDIGHQGLLFDKEWGWYDNRGRGYIPRLGRFPQRDPKGNVDGNSLYEYLMSRPTRGFDPYGFEFTEQEVIASFREMFPDSLAETLLNRAMRGKSPLKIACTSLHWYQFDFGRWAVRREAAMPYGWTVRIQKDLDKYQAAAALAEALLEDSDFGGIRDDEEYYQATKRQGQVEAFSELRARNLAEAQRWSRMLVELYMSGIAIANEAGDWVLTIDALQKGEMGFGEAALAMSPLISGGMIKAGRVLVKKGDTFVDITHLARRAASKDEVAQFLRRADDAADALKNTRTGRIVFEHADTRHLLDVARGNLKHVQEVKDAARGLTQRIPVLKKRLVNPALTAAERLATQQELGLASKTLDAIEDALAGRLPRHGQW